MRASCNCSLLATDMGCACSAEAVPTAGNRRYYSAQRAAAAAAAARHAASASTLASPSSLLATPPVFREAANPFSPAERKESVDVPDYEAMPAAAREAPQFFGNADDSMAAPDRRPDDREAAQTSMTSLPFAVTDAVAPSLTSGRINRTFSGRVIRAQRRR